MGWFKRGAPAATSCSFCQRTKPEVRRLVSGPGVAICDDCVALSAAMLTEASHGDGCVPVLGEMLRACVVGTPSERLIAPLAAATAVAGAVTPKDLRAAIVMIDGDAHDSVPFARARSTLFEALASLTAVEASRAIEAALLAGELDRAVAIQPVPPARDDDGWRLHAYLAELVRAPLGAPAIADLVDKVCELHASLDEEDAESVLALADITEAYAHVRAGNHAAALKRYVRYRSDPQLRPWHAIALGDALAATGDPAGARAAWSQVARRRAWDPYWPELAGERLGREIAPYR